MIEQEEIRENIVEALKNVIDPETGADVLQMRLVENLEVSPEGMINYIFRPSSPLCPIALTLVLEIIEAIKPIEGVTDQQVTVVDYYGADELNKILAELPLTKKL